jgi:hypothetical protein
MKATILILLVLALTVIVPITAFAETRGDQGHNGHGYAWGHMYSHGARWGLNDHHVWTGCNSGNGKGNTGGGSTGGGSTGGSGDGKGGDPGTVGGPGK